MRHNAERILQFKADLNDLLMHEGNNVYASTKMIDDLPLTYLWEWSADVLERRRAKGLPEHVDLGPKEAA